MMKEKWRSFLAGWLGIYWYRFEEGTVYAHYLGKARSLLGNRHSPLIETNDRSVI